MYSEVRARRCPWNQDLQQNGKENTHNDFEEVLKIKQNKRYIIFVSRLFSLDNDANMTSPAERRSDCKKYSEEDDAVSKSTTMPFILEPSEETLAGKILAIKKLFERIKEN
ncbi:hypothetical protein AVEN_140539-1 [Araneus ventricosus]|uniref:Uncharacterized protein n=1 Tax=Araneus ventricosus TaxID=182803 RepID=A0A4Y2L5J5_ARAVE|nr:hypothetical protein AVEN_140539-1 [Araneus ventricosus]